VNIFGQVAQHGAGVLNVSSLAIGAKDMFNNAI